jgi:hypothetical protein
VVAGLQPCPSLRGGFIDLAELKFGATIVLCAAVALVAAGLQPCPSLRGASSIWPN